MKKQRYASEFKNEAVEMIIIDSVTKQGSDITAIHQTLALYTASEHGLEIRRFGFLSDDIDFDLTEACLF